MSLTRAHSVFEIKSVDDDLGIIEGIATTPQTDRMDDVVEPNGAQFSLPLPLLWQHKSGEPIGQVIAAKVTDEGISIRAKIARGVLPEIDKAWALIKAGLVRGLSIGFQALETADIKGSFGQRFIKWNWLELSAVTIPANAQATMQTIKSIDAQSLRAASGTNAVREVVRLSTIPGVSGLNSLEMKGNAMTNREQIQQWENKRAATAAALAEIMKKSADEGAALDKEQSELYDGHKAELKTIDEHIARLKEYDKTLGTTAVAVVEDNADPAPIKVKAGEGVLRVNANLPVGIGLARYVKAFAFAKGNYQAAIDYAKQWDTSTPEVGMALKGAIAAGTTADSVWAGPLVYNQNLASAFLEFLRPMTIIGKIQGMRMVPFNIRYVVQDSGSTVGWVGQGLGKPLSKLTFTTGTLGIAKAAGIVVITQELARFSSPSAEMTVRDDLAAQMIQFLDQQFIDPGVAAVANVSPASVTNGSSAVRQAVAAWTSEANVITDVSAFLDLFSAQEIALNGAYWVMTPSVALKLSMLKTAGGENMAYPSMTINGGTWYGLPVIVSNSVPHSTSAGSIVALIVPQWIYMADDGGVSIDQSTEASLLMDSAPTTQTSATPTGSSVVSMWQTNSIAIRVERFINWSRVRAYGVGYIDNVHTS